MSDVLVGCDQYLVTCPFCFIQQVSVVQSAPSQLIDSIYRMIVKMMAERDRNALVKDNLHERLEFTKALDSCCRTAST